MFLTQIYFITAAVSVSNALQFPANPTSDISADERPSENINKTVDQSEINESGHEWETDNEDLKDKKFLTDALRTVLDPSSTVMRNDGVIGKFKAKVNTLENENVSLIEFMDEMDKLSLDVCKTSQEALWAYVTDSNNEMKKVNMMNIAAEEDEIKKQFWNILKTKYFNDELLDNDTELKRKFRIIRQRGTNVLMPHSKQREEIDSMQRIWSGATVCAYNTDECNSEDSLRTLGDIISIFKTSNDSEELAYYWKSYRDATGKKIRPIFRDYVKDMNQFALTENFTDVGEMWRYVFEDDDFTNTVDRLWSEMKPIYDVLLKYVKAKLKMLYKEAITKDDNYIPAHLLGNLWAQDWQAIYDEVAPYPERLRSKLEGNQTINSRSLFDAVDDFYQSLSFESARNSYADIKDKMTAANCVPSSHDMCDGVNYKINWCGEEITDVVVGLTRAARLLGHVQYFKHYRHLQPLYRDGPNPAFHDAISDVVALQLTSPEYLKTLNLVSSETGREVSLNHLLWVALEKFPLMAYAYVLDKWRWNVFADRVQIDWNQYWWDLRMNETALSPPVARDEGDLDPAAKYHVVSHAQYVTYLVSPVLEFQILMALCKKANHTGPLHECSIHGATEAGKMLSDGMSLGASKDWRTVLRAMTGESELKTEGVLQYFSILEEFLRNETEKLIQSEVDGKENTPVTVGAVVVVLTVLIILLYCIRKHNLANRILSVCGIRKNGSLDIATREVALDKTNVMEPISEDKV